MVKVFWRGGSGGWELLGRGGLVGVRRRGRGGGVTGGIVEELDGRGNGLANG